MASLDNVPPGLDATMMCKLDQVLPRRLPSRVLAELPRVHYHVLHLHGGLSGPQARLAGLMLRRPPTR